MLATRRRTTNATVTATNAQKPGSATGGTLTAETVESMTLWLRPAKSLTALAVLPRMSGRLTPWLTEVPAEVDASTVCELSPELSSAAEALRHWLPIVASTAKAAIMAISHAMRLPPTV